MRHQALDRLSDVARASGLIPPDKQGIVMVSGGADSAATAAALAGVVGPHELLALHVNYGLRPTADRDERIARDLCASLRIDLHVERVAPGALGDGNLQAAARKLRYAAAEQLRVRSDADWIATGHTRTDQAETVLYRLAVSPGSRALMGLADQSGRVIRPLLSLRRDEVREAVTLAGLPFCDDPTNEDPRFARNRIRHAVLPELAELSGRLERNIAETRAEIAEEAILLERVVLEALAGAGCAAGSTAVPARAVVAWDPALSRLALRALAERAAGRRLALGRARAAEIRRLAAEPEGGEIQLGGGVSAICESGVVRMQAGVRADAAPTPVRLPVPGECRIGGWAVRAELSDRPMRASGPGFATLDASALGDELEVRTWRHGDRIRPLGLGGTKTLQDLFTDRGVPRSVRHELPVITAGGSVAWVAGVAVSEDFRIAPSSNRVALLTAQPA